MAFNKSLAMEIGGRLRLARQNAGYDTIISFTSKYNLPRSTYNQYEIGDRLLCIDSAINFANIFNTNLLWLLTGKGNFYITDSSIVNIITQSNNSQQLLNENDFIEIVKSSRRRLPGTQYFSKEKESTDIDVALLEQILTKVYEILTILSNEIDCRKLAYLTSYIYRDMRELNQDDFDNLKLLDIITSAFKHFPENKKISNF